MAIGLLTYQRTPAAPEPDERELAVAAEDMGVDAVWFSEHHFEPDGHLPSVVLAMADVIAHTERIGVGSGVALLPLLDVPRTAAGLATLGATGRAIDFGVGMGYRDEEFDGFGLRRRDRAAVFENKLVELSDQLRRRDVGPNVRLWMGAIATPAVERAARLELPVVFPTGSSRAEMGRRIRRYRAVSSGQGEFAAMRDTVIAASAGEAEAFFERVVAPIYHEYFGRTVVPHDGRRVLGRELPAADLAAALGRFRNAAIVGDAAVLAEELAALADAGIGTCLLRCWFPGLGTEAQLHALQAVSAALTAAGGGAT